MGLMGAFMHFVWEPKTKALQFQLFIYFFYFICYIYFQIPGLVDQYMSTLLSLEQSPSSLPMLAACVDFCTSQKDMANINKHKVGVFPNTQLLNSFLHIIFQSCFQTHLLHVFF